MSINLQKLYGSLYGPLYIAVVLSTTFYGITCMQIFFYYVHYPDDRLRTKIFVAILWALNTSHEALCVSGVYKYIRTGLVTPSSLLVGNPELLIQYVPTATLAVATQGFLVHRIYIFGGKKVVAPLVWVLLAVIEIVCGIMYVVKALYIANGGIQVVDVSVLNSGSFVTIATITLSAAAGADILIAVCMTFLLVLELTTSRFGRTIHILQRLVIFAVNTGIWTATFALLAIILLHLFPTNLIYTAFSIPLGSVYCNTVLANLNARVYLGDGLAWGSTLNNITSDMELSNVQPLVFANFKGSERYGEASGTTVCETIED